MNKFYTTIMTIAALSLPSYGQVVASGDYVLELDIESYGLSQGDSSKWVFSIVELAANEEGKTTGSYVSSMPVLKGLWLGLYGYDLLDQASLYLDSTVMSNAPLALIDIWSKDTNNTGPYPRTRANEKFYADLNLSRFSAEGALDKDGVALGLSTRRLLIERFTRDYVGDSDRPSAYKELGDEVRVVSYRLVTAAGILKLIGNDIVDGVVSSTLTEGALTELRPDENGFVQGEDTIQVYQMTTDDVNNPGWIPVAQTHVNILGVEEADVAVDLNGVPLNSVQHAAAPDVKFAVRNLYPDSRTYISIKNPAGLDIYTSDVLYHNSTTVSQDDELSISASKYQHLAVNDGTYTANLVTLTVFSDTNDDGKGETPETIKSTTFEIMRSINVNGVMVSGSE